MRVGMLLALTSMSAHGCNQVFGVDETHLPPADAAPYCPEPSTPPPISRRLVQVAAQDCLFYSFSEVTRRAVASCRIPEPPYYAIWEGPLDGELAPTNIEIPDRVDLGYPRISTDGTELWVSAIDFNIGKYLLYVYKRSADQVWTFDRSLDGPNRGMEAAVLARTEGPDARLLVQIRPNANPSPLVELSDDGSGTWPTLVHESTYTDVGVDYWYQVGASNDGLRLVFAADSPGFRLFYAARAARSDPFGQAVLFPNVPVIGDARYQFTANCGRLYFSAIDSIFYATQ